MEKDTAVKLKFDEVIYSTKTNRLARVVTPASNIDALPRIELQVIAGNFFEPEGEGEKHEQKRKLGVLEVERDYELTTHLLASEEFTPTMFAALNVLMFQLSQVGGSVQQINQFLNSLSKAR